MVKRNDWNGKQQQGKEYTEGIFRCLNFTWMALSSAFGLSQNACFFLCLIWNQNTNQKCSRHNVRFCNAFHSIFKWQRDERPKSCLLSHCECSLLYLLYQSRCLLIYKEQRTNHEPIIYSQIILCVCRCFAHNSPVRSLFVAVCVCVRCWRVCFLFHHFVCMCVCVYVLQNVLFEFNTKTVYMNAMRIFQWHGLTETENCSVCCLWMYVFWDAFHGSKIFSCCCIYIYLDFALFVYIWIKLLNFWLTMTFAMCIAFISFQFLLQCTRAGARAHVCSLALSLNMSVFL